MKSIRHDKIDVWFDDVDRVVRFEITNSVISKRGLESIECTYDLSINAARRLIDMLEEGISELEEDI